MKSPSGITPPISRADWITRILSKVAASSRRKAAIFVTIGEPDIRLHLQPGSSRREEAKTSSSKKGQSLVTSAATEGTIATVEIARLDIYDPIKDEVKSRDVHDIAYWMVDDDYDG